ncbi:hypothetical protein L198_00812 [Cryptococcus wingfieldii CBS 7118]|uniref:Uncharacterized protein n=1 Tax=Cryptococcus wingfieldii CBS 7118 TaxID=1295528 RepID=A0A1E3K2M3_9TREE|nr:hypothetical protein L198_00812 [Cryptococcus wingfieldii CBS 7118]ODO07233.1 hypothetical protein L198_00812 [Cryptococcus wingfieldii CBS 7118]
MDRVNKWKREWVAPEGLPAESSYKVFKWVKSDVKAQFGNDAVYEVRDDTPGQDDDEGDEGEGQENEDDEDDEDGDNGQNGEESRDPAKGEVQAAQGGAETTGVQDDTSAQPEGEGDAPEAPKETESEALPETLSTAAEAVAEPQAALAPAPAPEPAPVPAADPQSITEPTAEPTHEAPIPPHHEIPSNAVEITNSIPGDSAQLGQGDLGLQGGVVAERSHEEDGDVEMEGVKEAAVEEEAVQESGDQMEVDQPATLVEEKGETPVEKDEGLVMGEIEPPVPEIAVEGEDKPTEVEKEAELP